MLNKKFIATAILAVSTAALFTACGTDSKSSNNTTVNIEDIKSNYVDMAYAVYSDSLSTAEDLKAAIDVFLEDPTQENLVAAQAAYKATRKPYQQSEIMRWDGAITSGKNLAGDDGDEGLSSVDDWEGQVNAWPLDETKIISIIVDETDVIDSDLLVQSQPEGEDDAANVTTGVHAIEFLLWNRDEDYRGAGQRDFNDFERTEVCKTSADTKGCRTSAYLRSAAKLLVADLKAMKSEWSPEAAITQGTLANNYLNSDEALDYMVQAIGSMAVGELAGARLAAGLWRPDVTKEDGIKDGLYEEEHDCFSDLSHVAVFYNYQGILNAWNGTYKKLDNTIIQGVSLARYAKLKDIATFKNIDGLLKETLPEMQKIYDAGERVGEARKSFDQIIEDSFKTYREGAGKTPELDAVEKAIINLAKIKILIVDLSEAMSLGSVDVDGIGETD